MKLTKQQVEDAMTIFNEDDFAEMAYYQAIADHLDCHMSDVFEALGEDA